MLSNLNSSSTGASLVSEAGVKCAGGSTPNPSAARASFIPSAPADVPFDEKTVAQASFQR
jgi:hypothetical protein